MRYSVKIVGFLFTAWLISSCYKEPNFSLNPKIDFDNIKKEIRIDQFTGSNKDSVIVTIDFQDGDGDLGLDETEKAIAQQNDDFNYLIKSFRRKNGNFVEFTPLVPLSGYFPKLKNDDRIGPIEGILSYTIEFPHPFTPKRDTVKFEVQIKDRSGNLSNSVETAEVILNQF